MPPSPSEDGAPRTRWPLLLVFGAPGCEQHTSVVYQTPSLVLCHAARAKTGSPGVSGSFWSTHDEPDNGQAPHRWPAWAVSVQHLRWAQGQGWGRRFA